MPNTPQSAALSRYDQDLPQTPANYAALTPVSLVRWAADVYPDHIAVLHGQMRTSWAELLTRAEALAAALADRGLSRGSTVTVMLPNTPAMIEAHYAVPMIGAVLNSVNTRLDAATVAFILGHSETELFIVDCEFAATVREALAILAADGKPVPAVVDVVDPVYEGAVERLGELDYDALLAAGQARIDTGKLDRATLAGPADEWDAIALNYTSGTTGNPKGVVVHHRGAYLNAVGNIVAWNLPRHPVYLWTLPMFACARSTPN